MPYCIVSTIAVLSGLYKKTPLIVGDQDADPDLMRFLGARLTTSYPTCGSPAMYVMNALPRTVFDNLEKRGYCLVTAQAVQEHTVWIFARPRIPDDDKTEILRGGPNDKSVQVTPDEVGEKKQSTKSKETEKTIVEPEKKEKIYEVESERKKALDPGRTLTTIEMASVDGYNQFDLIASRGDHAKIEPVLEGDGARKKIGLNTENHLTPSHSNLIMPVNQLSLGSSGLSKPVVNIGVGNEPSGSLILDGFTQTGYGDILRPTNMPKLPKIMASELPPSPTWNTPPSFSGIVSEDLLHLGCLQHCEASCCEN